MRNERKGVCVGAVEDDGREEEDVNRASATNACGLRDRGAHAEVLQSRGHDTMRALRDSRLSGLGSGVHAVGLGGGTSEFRQGMSEVRILGVRQ